MTEKRDGYTKRDVHHHPEGRGIPGRDDLLFDRAEMEHLRTRRLADAEKGRRGTGGPEDRRGDGAVQSDCEADESNMTL